MGQLAQQSMPFLTGTPFLQKYNYDVLSRLTSVTRPISSTNSTLQTTSYGYAGRLNTTTDPLGNIHTIVTDVNGWLRKTTDAVGTGYTVTRAYDSAGSLIGVTDSVGNTLLSGVTYKYGLKPFLVGSTDADRGAWIYTVDSLGERTGWTDAKGQSFSMTYDALSRPLTRTEPDLFSEWNYGSAAPNRGQLTSECTAATATANLCTTTGSSWLYNESHYYDSTGRPQYRWIVQSGNPGSDTNPVTAAAGGYLYTLGYSATTGLLSGLTYPKSTSSYALTLAYTYGSGLLQSVTDTSDTTTTCGTTCVLWTANAMNGFGEVTQETLGNGVVTNRSFDAVTSWLTAATAGVGGGSGLLNQSYLQDKDGNVIQRENNTSGLYENFYYDADNRLCAIVLGGTGSCTSSTIVYDGPGNINNQPGVGSYTYPAPGQPRPHAVTSITGTFNGITNPTFSYDANGNMTDRASSSPNIAWSSYNYPTEISAIDATGSEEVQFQYGPDRKRWQQIYSGPSGIEQTYYVGKKLEVVFTGTTNYRHYIYAGSEPVAVYSRTSAGVNTMSYMLEDHQAGISAITSSAGATDINESFSAFGTRRNPATWSGAPTPGDLNTIASLSRQGYTFQTWLGQSMGLNHMNGRVEDAILGRFLSPDPHIPDPSNAQSYNRYAYASNNPLTRVDPSGFLDDLPDPTPLNGCNPQSCTGDYPSGLVPSAPPTVAIQGPVQTNFDLVGSILGAGAFGVAAGDGLGGSSGDAPAAAANDATPTGDTGSQAQSQGSALNDPNYFSPQSAAASTQNPGTSAANVMEAVGYTTTFLTTITDMTEEASGAAQFVGTLGRVGAITGGLADSFSLGTQIGSMIQNGPTPANVSGAATSTINIGAAGLAIAQPETAPAVGVFFLFEMLFNVTTEQ